MSVSYFEHWRFQTVVYVQRIDVARSKRVSLNRMQQVWWRARYGEEAVVRGVQVRHCRKQTPGVRMAWVEEDFVCSSLLNNFSCIHNVDVVSNFCDNTKVVCDEDN